MSTLVKQTDPRGITTLTLNRPERHNAFDDVMIGELTAALEDIERDVDSRVLLLRASGKSFSAGADLNWMRRMADFSAQENHADAMQLATMLQTLNRLAKPTVVVVQGAVYGGGVGLVACCDIALATADAGFCLSEVKLGLVPATISPYVVNAIGARAARRYMLSAEMFDADTASRLGLVHGVCDPAEIDEYLAQVLQYLLKGGPTAQATAKRLIERVASAALDETLISETADTIAQCRASIEGREGLDAFLEKRKPNWIK